MSQPRVPPPIDVDLRSPTPPFEQVRAQIAARIRDGSLSPGGRLPTIRQLAGDLGLAQGTVARAYRELEQDQLVVTRRAQGTFVLETPTGETQRRLTQAAREFAQRVRELGVEPGAAIAAAHDELSD